MAQTSSLRTFVNVPQTFMASITPGMSAELLVREFPGRTFAGKVARSAGALLSSSRTLSVEVDVDNAAHLLRAGLFVNVSFAIPREHPNVVVPAEALIFNQQGLRVAVINEDKSVHLQPVTVYRDFGATIELSDGLRGGESIVLSPPTSLQEGGKVRVTSEQKIAEAAR